MCGTYNPFSDARKGNRSDAKVVRYIMLRDTMDYIRPALQQLEVPFFRGLGNKGEHPVFVAADNGFGNHTAKTFHFQVDTFVCKEQLKAAARKNNHLHILKRLDMQKRGLMCKKAFIRAHKVVFKAEVGGYLFSVLYVEIPGRAGQNKANLIANFAGFNKESFLFQLSKEQVFAENAPFLVVENYEARKVISEDVQLGICWLFHDEALSEINVE